MAVYAIFTNIAYKIKQRIKSKSPQIKNENYRPFVSIMIPAHNEESVIADTINTVLKLDYPNFEIIAIDDRSTDNTASVIRDLERKHPNTVIAFIRPEGAFPGKSAVLNDALKYAKGEAILVFDADATMDPDFLTNLVCELEPKDVGAVQARKIVRNKNVNILSDRQQLEEFIQNINSELTYTQLTLF